MIHTSDITSGSRKRRLTAAKGNIIMTQKDMEEKSDLFSSRYFYVMMPLCRYSVSMTEPGLNFDHNHVHRDGKRYEEADPNKQSRATEINHAC